MKIMMPVILMPSLIASMVNFYIFDLGDESFVLPSPIWLGLSHTINKNSKNKKNQFLSWWRWPFNWKTPIGYIFVYLDEFTTQNIGALFCVPLLGILVGSCWLTVAYVNDISDELAFLESNKMSKKSANELKEPFCKTINLYSDAKELSNHQLQIQHDHNGNWEY